MTDKKHPLSQYFDCWKGDDIDEMLDMVKKTRSQIMAEMTMKDLQKAVEYMRNYYANHYRISTETARQIIEEKCKPWPNLHHFKEAVERLGLIYAEE